jgi:hypothetical protein
MNMNKKDEEENYMILCVQDAIRLATKDVIKRPEKKLRSDAICQTIDFKDITKRIVYDYKFGEHHIVSKGTSVDKTLRELNNTV